MRTRKSSIRTLSDQASELVEQATPYVEAAREKIVNDVLPVAQSVLADARETAVEVAQDARDAAQAAAVRAEKSTRKSRRRAAKNAKAKARELAAAAAATPAAMAVSEKVSPGSTKKPRRGRRLLVLLGLAGLGAFVAKRLSQDSSSAPMAATPSNRPVPPAPGSEPSGSSMPPAPAEVHFEPDDEPGSDNPVADAAAESLRDVGPGGTPEGGADAGGAFLDEAVADAEGEPHAVTTPDRPLSEEDVSRSKRG